MTGYYQGTIVPCHCVRREVPVRGGGASPGPALQAGRPNTPVPFLLRAPVGGSDFSCMFRRFKFLMLIWALSLIPVMAMSVRILFTKLW